MNEPEPEHGTSAASDRPEPDGREPNGAQPAAAPGDAAASGAVEPNGVQSSGAEDDAAESIAVEPSGVQAGGAQHGVAQSSSAPSGREPNGTAETSTAAEDAADSDATSGLPGTDLRRLHPLTPLLRGWKFFAIAVAALGQDAIRDLNLKLFGIQLGAAIIIGLVLGMLSWWFTKYRIEGDVLRVDSGFLFRRSRRIRLDRLQAVDIVRPVLARLLGVAELRLEVAGGGRTEAPLAYLSEAGAHQLRAELLARAAGLDADTPEAPESRLVAVPAGVLFASTIVSAPFLVSLLGFVVVAITTVYLREVVGLAFLVPWALGGIGVLWQQFVAEYGFTVSESPDGLRIRKGLLDTVAQTVPPGRVQGVEIEQQFLWRPKGWVRLSVDVAGYGRGDGDNQKSSTLLPVAPWPVALGLLQRILPGVDVDSVPRVMAPRSARWLRPIGWKYLRHGVDERVFVTDRGWLTKRIAVVPHAKMQSVRIEQGPIQRRLGLATVHVDTPDGPVNAVALHRDAGIAREVAEHEAELSREARRIAAPERWMSR